ncbi:alkaline phosphatase family protein [Fulvivirga sp. RKSG066]|uniref:LTA synthase family protein n=1 Tax=Fulvivirga aurantia TaxID=2529383 RepID=UPI0012BB6631|nr:alkaline phosphatase family protein [Fulvivirga aurantia]MTI21190.1 alkaline phosphatase family protein [Fulvivirga aurantia]
MKNRVKLFLTYGLFWLCFFVAARLIFLVYYLDKSSESSLADILLSVLHGLRLDLSTTGYFLLIPGLVLVASSFVKVSIVRIILNIYTALLIVICAFVVVFDLEMYQHWGFRLDATPLLYVGDDTTIAISFWALLKLVVLWVVLVAVFLIGYKRYVSKKVLQLGPASWKSSLVLLLLTGVLIAPIRGTTGVAPINVGSVYFHESNMYVNHAAINVVYNSGYALSKIKRLKYPKHFLDKNNTEKYYNELFKKSGDTSRLIKTDKPNIVLIILESYTFKFIKALGGIEGVAPNIEALTKEGILFDNFYSSGDRTDKGIVSIISGYPAQPKGSIIKYPRKTQQLPFINKSLSELGYDTGFTYGGNIDFANFRSYLSAAGFDNITHSGDFPDSLNQSKWGVHDEFVFDRFLDETKKAQEPFFKVMLSLSSHEPFEVPMPTVIEGDDNVSKFLNSAHYTDKALGEFIDNAKETDWWKNSLIIITADHGHGMPDNGGFDNPNRFKIPMLWLGGALNKTDTVIHTLGSQTDIPNTILGQVDQPDDAYSFSNNLLSSDYKDFAVYIYNNGYGFISDDVFFVYDNVGKRYLKKEGINTNDTLPGMSYMQSLYNDYNSR